MSLRMRNGITVFSLRRRDPLSNAYPCEFILDGNLFFSVEQYYQYRKAIQFGDMETSKKILLSRYPYKCYIHGKEVRNFNKTIWLETHATKNMYNAVKAKFSSCEKLRKYLKDTRETTICQPNGRYWGVGLGFYDPDIFTPEKWRGLNQMGKILMRVRSEL